MSRTLLLVSVRCADEVATAVDGGAEIIDVSIRGFGAGAGNTQMDIFLTDNLL